MCCNTRAAFVPAAVAQRVRINTVDPGNGRIQKDVDLSKAAGAGQHSTMETM